MIGAILKERRESLGLLIDEIEKRTFLPKRYLLAIENDDFKAFPRISYAMQMVRAYARFLGFEDHEIAHIIKEFNPRRSQPFILFGKKVYILILILLIIYLLILFINL